MSRHITFDVAERLREVHHLDAVADESGGNIMCVYVTVGDKTWIAGTANERWGIDIYMSDDLEDSVDTEVPSTSTNVITIADALADAIKKESK